MSTKQSKCHVKVKVQGDDQAARTADNLATRFSEGRYTPIPKYCHSPAYLKQVGPNGLLFIALVSAAYDEGNHARPDEVVNGWLALPDDHLQRLWGGKSKKPIREARRGVLQATPAFFEDYRQGQTGRPWEYKIRATTPDDRVNPSKFGIGLPPRHPRRFPQDFTGVAHNDWREMAIDYLYRGFSVIPVAGKEPLVRWKRYQTSRATELELADWYKSHPGCGIAIVTGSLSNLVVVDIDGDLEAGMRLLADAGVEVPETTRVRSAHGYHLWFRHPGPPVQGPQKLLIGADGTVIDIRGDGNYIVAPPSLHPDGTRYAFEHEVPELPELPSQLYALIRERSKKAA